MPVCLAQLTAELNYPTRRDTAFQTSKSTSEALRPFLFIEDTKRDPPGNAQGRAIAVDGRGAHQLCGCNALAGWEVARTGGRGETDRQPESRRPKSVAGDMKASQAIRFTHPVKSGNGGGNREKTIDYRFSE